MRKLVVAILLAVGLVSAHAMFGGSGESAPANRVVDLLKRNEVVFGSFVWDRTEAGGVAFGEDPRLDFAFYDMQRSYDLDTLLMFMKGLRARGSQALLVRIAPIAKSREAARTRVAELLAAGVDGIIFPHVRNQDEAEFAVELLKAGRRGVWPLDPNGTVVGQFMIEDRVGLENAHAIISTPGVGIASPGEGSLREAFDNDAKAVEAAIQTIIATCRSANTVCAKLVAEDDVEQRLKEGFRIVIASGSALDLGRRIAGREVQ